MLFLLRPFLVLSFHILILLFIWINFRMYFPSLNSVPHSSTANPLLFDNPNNISQDYEIQTSTPSIILCSPVTSSLLVLNVLLSALFSTILSLICALLGYYAALSGSSVPTFRDNLSVPSSRVKKSSGQPIGPWPLKIGPIGCLETQRCVISQKSADLMWSFSLRDVLWSPAQQIICPCNATGTGTTRQAPDREGPVASRICNGR